MDKKKQLIIKVVTLLAFIIIFSLLIIVANRDNPTNYKTGANSPIRYEKAKVIEVLEDNTEVDKNSEGLRRGSQKIEVKIQSGEHKGETKIIDNHLGLLFNVYAKEGTKVIVRIDSYDDDYHVSIYNYDRFFILYGTILLFCILMCVIGGKKGLLALLGLVFTIICVMKILVPMIYKGAPVLPVTMFIVAITAIVCLILLDGLNTKTITAIIGTVLGVFIAGLLSYIIGKLARISGLNMEEAESLLLIASDKGLKIRDLFVSGILISALGAVIDIAMSIASALYELHTVNPMIKQHTLFRSGMNIGKDAMGTMANTLILAFVGTSLNLVLMIFAYGVPITQLINTDLIAIEIIRAITASIGIISTVPIVAFLGSRIIKKNTIKGLLKFNK